VPDDITRWLTEHANPLSSLTPGVPTEDMKPLGDVLRGTRIVGLGESTHGTSEFFRLKHRIVEFLVREAGFTTLAMEASQSAGHALNVYVARHRRPRTACRPARLLDLAHPGDGRSHRVDAGPQPRPARGAPDPLRRH
jgi:erythromycin esterase-like protein